jgi:hypothetical protein
MVFSALLTVFKPGWGAHCGSTGKPGRLLFFVSDSMLAWGAFCKPSRTIGLYVITYHIGQIFIIFGAALALV